MKPNSCFNHLPLLVPHYKTANRFSMLRTKKKSVLPLRMQSSLVNTWSRCLINHGYLPPLTLPGMIEKHKKMKSKTISREDTKE